MAMLGSTVGPRWEAHVVRRENVSRRGGQDPQVRLPRGAGRIASASVALNLSINSSYIHCDSYHELVVYIRIINFLRHVNAGAVEEPSKTMYLRRFRQLIRRASYARQLNTRHMGMLRWRL